MLVPGSRVRSKAFFLACLMIAGVAAGAAAQASQSPIKHPIDQWLSDCLAKDPSTQGMLRASKRAIAGGIRAQQGLQRTDEKTHPRRARDAQGIPESLAQTAGRNFKLLQIIYAKKDERCI